MASDACDVRISGGESARCHGSILHVTQPHYSTPSSSRRHAEEASTTAAATAATTGDGPNELAAPN